VAWWPRGHGNRGELRVQAIDDAPIRLLRVRHQSGSPTALDGAVDEYLRAIFVDTLVSLQGLPNEQKSEQVRIASADALRQYLGRDFGAP
jgi:hypothetical protein